MEMNKKTIELRNENCGTWRMKNQDKISKNQSDYLVRKELGCNDIQKRDIKKKKNRSMRDRRKRKSAYLNEKQSYERVYIRFLMIEIIYWRLK
jgi:hypothetical protein